jgi:hypothetical protein
LGTGCARWVTADELIPGDVVIGDPLPCASRVVDHVERRLDATRGRLVDVRYLGWPGVVSYAAERKLRVRGD